MVAQRRTAVCREGWLYLAVMAMVFAGALVREVNLLMLLAGMLAGPLLLSRFMAVTTLRGLRVRRNVPKAVCAGDLLVTGLTLTNPRRRLGCWAVAVEDALRRNGQPSKRRTAAAAAARVYFPYLAAGQSREGVYRGRLAERGRYEFGPLRIHTRFPFGLLSHSITLGQTAGLTVLPRLGRLTHAWIARHHESFAGTSRRERRAGLEGDFYGIRPWRSGDSRRWIHSRTSARAGRLMVRQFEQPRNRDVAVLLDLWQPAQAGSAHRENVELAVSFAATLVADLCRKGDSDIYLGMASPESDYVSGPASPALLHEAMERLALVEAQQCDPLGALLDAAAGRIGRGTEIIVVATRPANLSDRARFGALQAGPNLRAALRQVRVVDASSEEISRYFQMD